MKTKMVLLFSLMSVSSLVSARSFYGLTTEGKACGIKIENEKIFLMGEYDSVMVMKGHIFKDKVYSVEKRNYSFSIDLNNRELVKRDEIEEIKRTILNKAKKNHVEIRETIKFEYNEGDGLEKSILHLTSLENPKEYTLQKDTTDNRLPAELVGKYSFWFDLNSMKQKTIVSRQVKCTSLTESVESVSSVISDLSDQHSSDL